MRVLGGMITAALIVLTSTAAALQKPAEFIAGLYAEKAAAEAKDDYGVVDRIVAAHMTAGIRAAWTKAAGADEPLVDGDIFYDAQDWDIKDLTFSEESASDAAAVVRADFSNLGQAKQVRFDLVVEAGAWKIANIRYQEGYDLKGMLAGTADAPAP